MTTRSCVTVLSYSQNVGVVSPRTFDRRTLTDGHDLVSSCSDQLAARDRTKKLVNFVLFTPWFRTAWTVICQHVMGLGTRLSPALRFGGVAGSASGHTPKLETPSLSMYLCLHWSPFTAASSAHSWPQRRKWL